MGKKEWTAARTLMPMPMAKLIRVMKMTILLKMAMQKSPDQLIMRSPIMALNTDNNWARAQLVPTMGIHGKREPEDRASCCK
eukprot:15326541-Ditylum_brightwellii.AAC.1